jgi:hypothetical protein
VEMATGINRSWVTRILSQAAGVASGGREATRPWRQGGGMEAAEIGEEGMEHYEKEAVSVIPDKWRVGNRNPLNARRHSSGIVKWNDATIPRQPNTISLELPNEFRDSVMNTWIPNKPLDLRFLVHMP